jgi:nicotinate-nucleotide--dimethylbenzimidazole phosphoribosyltransferase
MALAGTALPFDDIRDLARAMPDLDADAAARVRSRDSQLTKPPGSLGRLETIVEWLAAVQAKAPPSVSRPLVAIFAGNHGVVARGVSPYPQEVTRQMLENFSAGGAAINQICSTFDIGLKVFDLALDIPTGDITREAALDEKACAATMAFGMEAVSGGIDLLVLGEMGIGNTTIAAAIYHGLYGGEAAHWVGRGTGVDDAGLGRKIEAVREAVSFHGDHLADPLELLRRLGGREIAAMVHAMDPALLDHCIAGHLSAEGAHADVLQRLGKPPLLQLGMRLGEGSGAALSVAVIKAALACHIGMATFTQAGVTDKS